MRLSTCSVRSLYRSDSLTTAARKLARCKLDVVGMHEVRCDKEVKVRAGDYIFFSLKERKIINLEQVFCTPQNSISREESRVCK